MVDDVRDHVAETADRQQPQSASLFSLIRSYESFEKYLARAVSMRVVSYCTSPKMLLELFEDYELEELEVIVGEQTDFREVSFAYKRLPLLAVRRMIGMQNTFSAA